MILGLVPSSSQPCQPVTMLLLEQELYAELNCSCTVQDYESSPGASVFVAVSCDGGDGGSEVFICQEEEERRRKERGRKEEEEGRRRRKKREEGRREEERRKKREGGGGRERRRKERGRKEEEGKEGNISMNITVYNSFTYIHAH